MEPTDLLHFPDTKLLVIMLDLWSDKWMVVSFGCCIEDNSDKKKSKSSERQDN
jgi:hypothetical protein